MKKGDPEFLFVFGDPIGHSLSPIMHNYALKRLGKHACYLPLRVVRNGLKAAVESLRDPNVLGANITIPHKERVLKYLDEVTEESKAIGAVNTIFKRKEKLCGTTTDPTGIIDTLKEARFNPRGKHIVVLGSGGSARTAGFAFALKIQAKSLHFAARRPVKLRPIVRDIRSTTGAEVTTSVNRGTVFESAIARAQLVVNCTSAGMNPYTNEIPLPPKVLHRDLVVFDLVYNPLKTKLMEEAERAGCRTVSGLGMLLHQGRASLQIWLNSKIPITYFGRKLLVNKLLE